MTTTTHISEFDEWQKYFAKTRARNNLIVYIGLNLLGGGFIIFAITTKGFVSDVLSDFAVNIAAGAFSAAVIFALIQQKFSDKEKDNERERVLVHGITQFGLMRDIVDRSHKEISKSIAYCATLLSRGERRQRPEAKRLYFDKVAVLLTIALDEQSIAKGYADIALKTIQNLWDEFYVELAKSNPQIAEVINIDLEAIMSLISKLQNLEEVIKKMLEHSMEKGAQVATARETDYNPTP